ncbi:MAG TPA: endonuclease [Rhodobacteraceae bacterium]|jgi:endonuclease/exonuclease/phosphatase family metal-dependent hydrolase|nr:endonuclease [Paracoccaceae bacterium]
MRIATYNVEWFDALFDPDGNLLLDDKWSRRRDVTRVQQLEAIAQVFKAMNADVVMVIEAPDSSRSRDSAKALEKFSAHFGLRTRKALMGYENDTQQEITLLYDPDLARVQHDPVGAETGKKGGHDAPRFDGVFRRDLDVDATPELITFSKPPLEVALKTKAGNAVRLIGVHIKSKAPHGANGKAEVMRKAIANRRKQMAQCIWLRMRVQQHLDAGQSVMVLGDFNDGPGLDEYEKLFGRSSVEIVLGENGQDRLYDPHAEMILKRKLGAKPSSSRFFLRQEKRYLSVLLDYIMVSADLKALEPAWRIWHPFDDPDCYHQPDLRESLLMASDHFPVSIDIEF